MKISDSEMELMKIIWSSDKPVTSAELAEKLNTEWKGATIRTFLKRLTAKGALKMRQSQKINYYTPAISEDGYKKMCTEEFLNDMYSGSIKNMLAALYSGENLSDDKIKELRDWFDNL